MKSTLCAGDEIKKIKRKKVEFRLIGWVGTKKYKVKQKAVGARCGKYAKIKR